jgi:GntR family transcriptional regulator
VTPAVNVDLNDPTPPYEQVRRQLVALITSGQLAAGERLPSVRQLARDLGLANGTVARAYAELEAARLVTTRRGGGTTVAANAVTPARATRLRLDCAARSYVETARHLGFAQDEAHEAIARAWR